MQEFQIPDNASFSINQAHLFYEYTDYLTFGKYIWWLEKGMI